MTFERARLAAVDGARAMAAGWDARTTTSPPAADPIADFTEYVEDSYHRLLRTAVLLAGDAHAGEELLQSALTRTWEHWEGIRDPTRVDGYVRVAMVNQLRSRWRRPIREQATDDLPETTGADALELLADRDQLQRGFRTLPARYRSVLVLRYFEDLDVAETARVLGCSEGTVKSQTSRALGHLRRSLTARGGRD